MPTSHTIRRVLYYVFFLFAFPFCLMCLVLQDRQTIRGLFAVSETLMNLFFILINRSRVSEAESACAGVGGRVKKHTAQCVFPRTLDGQGTRQYDG